ncbi:MAG: hypothetical protein WBK95_04840 [Sulfurimonas sp.]
MKKSFLALGGAALLLGNVSVWAAEYDLKANMQKLHSELNAIQTGFILGDKNAVSASLDIFAKDAKELLGEREGIIKKLPEDMKNKKHKANIATESARTIDFNAAVIKEAIANPKGLSNKKRREQAQVAYLNIVNACFACHNVVRDKEVAVEK